VIICNTGRKDLDLLHTCKDRRIRTLEIKTMEEQKVTNDPPFLSFDFDIM
jgi:hypothetical protein